MPLRCLRFAYVRLHSDCRIDEAGQGRKAAALLCWDGTGTLLGQRIESRD